jgi:hypothetical protein
MWGSDRPLLRIPSNGRPLRGPRRRTCRDNDGFRGKGRGFLVHDICLFCLGRDGSRLGGCPRLGQGQCCPCKGRAAPLEGPVEAGAEPSPASGLKPVQTSIPSSSSSSSSSSSLLGEDSSWSPSLACALWCFSSVWRATILLRACLFAWSFFRLCSSAASRCTCLAAASYGTGGRAIQKARSSC